MCTLFSSMITGFLAAVCEELCPNLTFDYGSRAAALWLDRGVIVPRERSTAMQPAAPRRRLGLSGRETRACASHARPDGLHLCLRWPPGP